jgi:hypothetical protein
MPVTVSLICRLRSGVRQLISLGCSLTLRLSKSSCACQKIQILTFEYGPVLELLKTAVVIS